MANDWNESTLADSRLTSPSAAVSQLPLRPAGLTEGLYQQRLAVAAHLHLLLRRKLGRVTDVEWMARSEDYARAMVQLALADPTQTELVLLGQRLLALLPATATTSATAASARPPAAPVLRYVRSLR